MGCGCRKNSMRSRPVSGPRPQGALKPVTRTGQNIINPPKTVQPMSQKTSQTPPSQRSASGANLEKRKLQQIRRDAIRRAFGK